MTNIIKLFTAIFIHSISWLFIRRKKDIWLIAERPSEAKDNGFHLFKYIRNKHSEQEIYYIISKDAKQRERINCLGNVIGYNSLKHYIFFLRAQKLILTFETSTFPASRVIWYWYRLKLLKKTVVYLSHGITKDNLVHQTYGGRFKFDLFVCGVRAEHEYAQKRLKYPSNVARLLGLPRFDALKDTHTNRKIFFMPTWRNWMNEYNHEQFRQSEYVKALTGVLEDKRLIRLLENNDAELVLYLHDVFQQRFRHVINSKHYRIFIANSEAYDVQELMKNSTVMITDYSSVAFDFAYMDKPLVYFQFDEDEFFATHFKKGYFDYREHGFGPVVCDSSGVIDELERIFSNSTKEDIYHQRRQNFFEFRDNENCERNYLAIKEL